MKMPNLASLYHCGCSYLMSVAQSGRNGPSCAWRSASVSRRLRSPSYFATDCCHSRSIWSADLVLSVGASGSVVVADCASEDDPQARASRKGQAIRLFMSGQIVYGREAICKESLSTRVTLQAVLNPMEKMDERLFCQEGRCA